jgi:hypothetical protein
MARLNGLEAKEASWFVRLVYWLVKRKIAKLTGKALVRESLPSWLYGVAYRVCQRARREAARRKKRETFAAKPIACDPAKEAAWRELCA